MFNNKQVRKSVEEENHRISKLKKIIKVEQMLALFIATLDIL